MYQNEFQLAWQPGFTLLQMELMVISCAYAYYKGNKSQAAKALDINIKTFDSKLAEIEVMKEKEKIAEDERRKQRELFEQRSRGMANSTQLNWSDAPYVEDVKVQAPQAAAAAGPKLEDVQRVSPRQAAQANQRRGR